MQHECIALVLMALDFHMQGQEGPAHGSTYETFCRTCSKKQIAALAATLSDSTLPRWGIAS